MYHDLYVANMLILNEDMIYKKIWVYKNRRLIFIVPLISRWLVLQHFWGLVASSAR